MIEGPIIGEYHRHEELVGLYKLELTTEDICHIKIALDLRILACQDFHDSRMDDVHLGFFTRQLMRIPSKDMEKRHIHFVKEQRRLAREELLAGGFHSG